jgi:hypothetical protein
MFKINDLVSGAGAGAGRDLVEVVEELPSVPPAVPQVRSSGIYVSESRAAVVEPEQPPVEVERRSRSTRTSRTSTSRTRVTRERRAAQAEAGVAEHPEWRQTITLEALGRHARDDHRRSTDIERESGDARHRAGAASQPPFRLICT